MSPLRVAILAITASVLWIILFGLESLLEGLVVCVLGLFSTARVAAHGAATVVGFGLCRHQLRVLRGAPRPIVHEPGRARAFSAACLLLLADAAFLADDELTATHAPFMLAAVLALAVAMVARFIGALLIPPLLWCVATPSW